MKRRVCFVAFVVLLLPILGVADSAAQESGDGLVLLILDASGSMNRTDDNGVALIDGAKSALGRLVGGLSDESQVGLMVYGHRVPNDDRANGCRDIELIAPVGPLNRDEMLDAVERVDAKGFTPIGSSLEEAAAALPNGRGTVILISDGEDTCAPPDPCEVAADLLGRGVDVRVHTVGFFLGSDEAARSQLQCIANATDGTYHEVDAIETLASELGALVSDALPEGTQAVLVPLDGATSVEFAPLMSFRVMEPPLDVLRSSVEGVIKPGETRWYAFDVVDGPSAAMFWSWVEDLVPDSLPGEYVRISIVDGDGVEYQTGSSRFGRHEIELFTVDSGAENSLGTTASFNGFDVWWADDENVADGVSPLGLDEEGYDAVVVEMLLRPAPPPLTDGRYFVGIQWDAEPSDDQRVLVLDTHLRPHLEVKHLTYTDAEGSSSAATPTNLLVPSSSEGWVAPLDDEITNRGGFLGSIRSSERTWYQVQIPPGSSIKVRAFLNRPTGASGDGEFRVELQDSSGDDIGEARPGYTTALRLDDLENLHSSANDVGHPNGISPRPLVGVLAHDTEGPVLIVLNWDGPLGDRGQVEFVVDIVAGDDDGTHEAQAQPQTPEPVPLLAAPPIAEGPAESAEFPTALLAAVLAALIGSAAAYMLYHKRTNHD